MPELAEKRFVQADNIPGKAEEMREWENRRMNEWENE